jgi:hypothetical protein
MVRMAGCHLQCTHLHPAEKEEGREWGLTDVDAKCRALLLTRVWTHGQREESASAEWQQYWKLQTYRETPPCPEDTEGPGILADICP